MEYGGIEDLENDEVTFSEWLKIRSNILLSLIEGKDVLEAGCGLGGFSKFLKDKGFTVTAIDVSNECIVRASQKHPDVTFFQDDISDPRKLKLINSFDTVVMSEVLEHIPDEKKALHSVLRLLKEQGVLVLSVPAHNFLFSSFDIKIGHQRRYNKRTLINTLTQNGYRVEKCFYWNFPGIIARFFLCKVLGRTPAHVRKGLLTNIYSVLLKLESKPKQTFPTGLTLIAKARKLNL